MTQADSAAVLEEVPKRTTHKALKTSAGLEILKLKERDMQHTDYWGNVTIIPERAIHSIALVEGPATIIRNTDSTDTNTYRTIPFELAYTQHVAAQQQRCLSGSAIKWFAIETWSKQQRTLKAVTHITVKGGCTHNCEIFAEFSVNGRVHSCDIFCWFFTHPSHMTIHMNSQDGCRLSNVPSNSYESLLTAHHRVADGQMSPATAMGP